MIDHSRIGAALVLVAIAGAVAYVLVQALAPDHLLPALGFVGIFSAGVVLVAAGGGDDD